MGVVMALSERQLVEALVKILEPSQVRAWLQRVDEHLNAMALGTVEASR